MIIENSIHLHIDSFVQDYGDIRQYELYDIM